MSDGPWDIPKTWAWSQMGQFADVIGGGTPRTDDSANFNNGDIPWITPADLSGYTSKQISRGARNITRRGLEKSGARLMPAGSVLFSSRAPIGYVAIAANPVSTNQGFKSFVLPAEMLSDYLYYYLQRARELAVALSSGTTFREISGANAALIPVPLAPPPEQKRIVAEIEEHFTRLEAGLAALKRARANLKRYRAAVLKAAVEGRLIPELRFPSHETSVSQWPRVRVGDILAESLANGRSPRATEAGVKILRLTSIRDHIIDSTENRLGVVPESDRRELSIRALDVFISRGSGSVHLVGRAGLVRRAPDETVVFPDTMIRVRLDPERVEPRYFVYIWNSPLIRHELESVARTTAGIHKISQKDIAKVELPLPSLAMQEAVASEIERRFSVLDELAGQVEADLRRAQRLRQAILKLAFEGKLVPQDPTDEPASVLLERVRQPRCTTTGRAKPQVGTSAKTVLTS